jgi:hypothetical protein
MFLPGYVPNDVSHDYLALIFIMLPKPYRTVRYEFPPTWYFYVAPPSSTASEAVPYPEKRYEAKNRGIVSTQEWKREWNFLPS